MEAESCEWDVMSWMRSEKAGVKTEEKCVANKLDVSEGVLLWSTMECNTCGYRW